MAPFSKMNSSGKIPISIKIATVYFLVGALWILFSAQVLEALVHDPRVMTEVSMIKGWGFVLITASLLYVLINRYTSRIERSQEEACIIDAKYREIVERANSIILIMDNTGNVTYLNGFAQRFFGYSTDEVIDRNVFETIFPPVDMEGRDLQLMIEQVPLNPDSHLSNITENTLRSGERVWIAWTAKPVLDENGQIGEILCVGNDITERKKSEEALRESEEKFSVAFRRGPAISIITALEDGTYIDVNDKFVEVSGYTREELLSMKSVDIFWRRNQSRRQFVDSLLMQGNISGEEIAFSTKTGEPVYGLANTELVTIGGVKRILTMVLDITERKKTERALKESESRLKTIFQLANEGVWVIDNQGVTTEINPRMCAILGVNRQEILGRKIFDFVDDDNKAIFERQMKLRAEGKAGSYDIALSASNGAVVFCRVNGAPLLDGSGNKAGSFAMVTDITDRMRDERERELAIEFLRLMQEVGNKKEMIAACIAFFKERSGCEAIGIRLREGDDYPYFETAGFTSEFVQAESSLCVRGDGCEITGNSASNPALACMCGNVILGRFDPSRPFFTTSGSFWTNSTTELMAIKTEAERMACTRDRCNGEGYESVALVPLAAGTARFGLLQLNDRRKGRFTAEDIALWERLAGYLAVALARFDSEERLRDSEEQFKAMFETASIGIVQGDPKSALLVRVNRRMCEITGYSSEELLGMRIQELTHPEDRERDREEFEKLVSGNSQVYRLEKRYIRKDGRTIWVNVNGAVMRDSSGQPIRTVATIEEITERKRLEEEQAQVEAQLRQAQKLEALGTLAGGVAHDFNNILGIIMGYTELSRMEIEEGSPLGKNLQQVMNASKRARELVKQILAFSRRSEHQKLPLQLDIIVKEAMKILRPSLPSTIEIKTEVLSKSVVLADPTQMHQVLMNLCTNAAHSMREKGGVLEVGLRDKALGDEHIRPSGSLQPGRYVELTVKDNGHGIDPEMVDLIFDPFFTTKELGEGTGLGLSVVHGIVKNHGGTIDVESTVGRGTAFTVVIPALESRQEFRAEEIAVPLSTGKERVLVVDDEPLLAEMVRMMLSNLGYDAVSRTSGIDALETFRNQPEGKAFELVITDMTMPHLTGKDLAREISRLRAEVPVILMTGFSEMIDAEKAKILGMQGFLMKPVALNDLAAQVRKLLDARAKGI